MTVYGPCLSCGVRAGTGLRLAGRPRQPDRRSPGGLIGIWLGAVREVGGSACGFAKKSRRPTRHAVNPARAGGKVTEAVSSRLLRSSFLAILAGCAKALES